MYIEHIGTTGVGSNIINKYKTSKNGHNCYRDLKAHFMNTSYLENKATTAEANIKNASYHGERHNFTLQSYYDIFTIAFNDLSQAWRAIQYQ